MNLEFSIGEMALDKSEATAILNATEGSPVIKIDISRHVDHKLIDAKKLFALSVEKKNPQLASLAAKLAINGPVKTERRRYMRTGKRALNALSVTQLTAEQAIEQITTNSSLKSLGAAMILTTCQSGEQLTLRQIATKTVNKLAYRGTISPDSSCFRGFRSDGEGNYKAVTQETGIKRTDCYHASPMYTALRDGLSFLVSSGMAIMEEAIAFGSEDKELDETSMALRRTVYKVKLTSAGYEAADSWGDVGNYINSQWSVRVRHSSTVKLG